MSSTTVISHSEVDAFLLCEQRHFYAFGDATFGPLAGLEPKTFSDSLYRGIIGHEAMATFLKSFMAKGDFDRASRAGISEVQTLLMRESNPSTSSMKIVTDLVTRILPRAFQFMHNEFLSQGWEIAYVEHTFRLEIPLGDTTLVYPFKPDAIIGDPHGNLYVFDHKFIYNFYTPDEINLLPQIPKYIGALRALGIHVKGGYYNQIRWREVKDLNAHNRADRFLPSVARIQNSFKQQVEVMRKIADLKNGDLDEWRDNNLRTLNGMVCKNCSFKLLCASELNGQETTLAKRVDFRSNTYGYSEGDE
ncbi:PD-(D/E)XK nuclease family protein [Candidatus Kaiserbacteria bacterium]|nr:PD-(D/E)XK nuclease family protein [Candidatus Kaiserbacteria bacterium]